MNQEYESVPVRFLPEAHQVKDNIKPPVQEHVEPAPVQNVETVGAPPRESLREEEPVRRTYEDAFMEEVQNLGPVRQRRMPNRLQWKEAMKSEYSSLIKNDTWKLVPPPEGKNIVGSR